jgi:hypothetical protein
LEEVCDNGSVVSDAGSVKRADTVSARMSTGTDSREKLDDREVSLRRGVPQGGPPILVSLVNITIGHDQSLDDVNVAAEGCCSQDRKGKIAIDVSTASSNC